jgi:hypothetical protein
MAERITARTTVQSFMKTLKIPTLAMTFMMMIIIVIVIVIVIVIDKTVFFFCPIAFLRRFFLWELNSANCTG